MPLICLAPLTARMSHPGAPQSAHRIESETYLRPVDAWMIDPMNHNACLTSSLMEIFSYLSLNPRLGFPFRDTADDLEFSRIERDNKVPRFKFHDSFECSRIAFGLLGRYRSFWLPVGFELYWASLGHVETVVFETSPIVI